MSSTNQSNINQSMEFRLKPEDTSTYISEDSYNRLDSGICLSYQSAESISTHSTQSLSCLSSDLSKQINELDINKNIHNNFFVQNKDGDTPLHIAVIQNNQNVFWQIIDSQPPKEYLNIQNFEFYQTPLHLAVETEMTSIIECLVALGVATNLKDCNGNTPLHIACARGDFVSVTRLMVCRDKMEDESSQCQRRCFDIITPNVPSVNGDELRSLNFNGKSCLHLALETHGINRMRIIKLLVCQCGADINMPDGRSGYTILHELVRLGDQDGLRDLLNLPIPQSSAPLMINPLNFEHMTPLDMALILPNMEVRQIILSASGMVSPGRDYLSDSSSESS